MISTKSNVVSAMQHNRAALAQNQHDQQQPLLQEHGLGLGARPPMSNRGDFMQLKLNYSSETSHKNLMAKQQQLKPHSQQSHAAQLPQSQNVRLSQKEVSFQKAKPRQSNASASSHGYNQTSSSSKHHNSGLPHDFTYMLHSKLHTKAQHHQAHNHLQRDQASQQHQVLLQHEGSGYNEASYYSGKARIGWPYNKSDGHQTSAPAIQTQKLREVQSQAEGQRSKRHNQLNTQLKQQLRPYQQQARSDSGQIGKKFRQTSQQASTATTTAAAISDQKGINATHILPAKLDSSLDTQMPKVKNDSHSQHLLQSKQQQQATQQFKNIELKNSKHPHESYSIESTTQEASAGASTAPRKVPSTMSLGLKAAYEKVNKSFDTRQLPEAAYLATEDSIYQYKGSTTLNSAIKKVNGANFSMTDGSVNDGLTLIQSPVIKNPVHRQPQNLIIRRPQSDLNIASAETHLGKNVAGKQHHLASVFTKARQANQNRQARDIMTPNHGQLSDILGLAQGQRSSKNLQYQPNNLNNLSNNGSNPSLAYSNSKNVNQFWTFDVKEQKSVPLKNHGNRNASQSQAQILGTTSSANNQQYKSPPSLSNIYQSDSPLQSQNDAMKLLSNQSLNDSKSHNIDGITASSRQSLQYQRSQSTNLQYRQSSHKVADHSNNMRSASSVELHQQSSLTSSNEPATATANEHQQRQPLIGKLISQAESTSSVDGHAAQNQANVDKMHNDRYADVNLSDADKKPNSRMFRIPPSSAAAQALPKLSNGNLYKKKIQQHQQQAQVKVQREQNQAVSVSSKSGMREHESTKPSKILQLKKQSSVLTNEKYASVPNYHKKPPQQHPSLSFSLSQHDIDINDRQDTAAEHYHHHPTSLHQQQKHQQKPIQFSEPDQQSKQQQQMQQQQPSKASISTFDRIIKDSANGANSMVKVAKMKTIKSSSRQQNRKNKVILPKIMFYNQSGSSKQLELPSLDNSDRLISMDRATIDHFPMSANQLDSSADEIAQNMANEQHSEHNSITDLIPRSDFSNSLIADYEMQASANRHNLKLPIHSANNAGHNHQISSKQSQQHNMSSFSAEGQKSPIDSMLLLNYLKQPVSSTSALNLAALGAQQKQTPSTSHQIYRRSPKTGLVEGDNGYETNTTHNGQRSGVTLTAKVHSPDLKASKKGVHRIMISNQHKFAQMQNLNNRPQSQEQIQIRNHQNNHQMMILKSNYHSVPGQKPQPAQQLISTPLVDTGADESDDDSRPYENQFASDAPLSGSRSGKPRTLQAAPVLPQQRSQTKNSGGQGRKHAASSKHTISSTHWSNQPAPATSQSSKLIQQKDNLVKPSQNSVHSPIYINDMMQREFTQKSVIKVSQKQNESSEIEVSIDGSTADDAHLRLTFMKNN